MLRLFRKLMPREDRFFEMFGRHAAIGVQASERLAELLAAQTPETVATVAEAISSLEKKADAVTREVLLATRRSFVTPFDRGDIKDLVQSMDDAVDAINKVARISLTYDVASFTDGMREIGGQATECAKLVARLVPLLERPGENVQRIHELADEIRVIEECSDATHQAGLKALYAEVRAGRADGADFVVLSRLYDQLEKVVDSLEDVADEVTAITIESV